METRYNLKSPGEPGWGGGRGPGTHGAAPRPARVRRPSRLLRARALREAAAGPWVQAAGRAAAADPPICWRSVAPGLFFPVSAEGSWRQPSQGQV